jgi:hypothetical protein
MPMYEVERITIEVVSAIACFILLRYMTRPFRVTGENLFLGLPLGFGFLGVSYAFSALSYSPLIHFPNWGWVQLFVRGFAFIFLALMYYFSRSEKTRQSWNFTLFSLAIASIILILFAIFSPQISRPEYVNYYIFVRIVSLICLGYISIHSLKSHLQHSDSTTLIVPLAYILLAIDQYSSIIWVVDLSYLALFGGLAFRLASLAVFLYVSYNTFYSQGKVE